MRPRDEHCRCRSILPRLILLTISIAMSLAAAELVLRRIGYSYRLYLERVVFGAIKPSNMGQYFEPDPDLFWVPKRPTPYAEMLSAARRQQPGLVFMGCSCTQFGSYPGHLAALIQKACGGKALKAANLGVAGWSSYQGLQQLKRDILPLKPRVILIYYGWNDHWIGFGIEDKDVAKINRSLAYHLQQFRVVQLATSAYMRSRGKEPEQFPNRVSSQDFEQNLRSMVRLARQENIQAVLVTAPSSHERRDDLGPVQYLVGRWLRRLDDLIPLHREYVSVVRKVAAGEGAILCDLYDRFAALPRDRVVGEYFMPDGIHLTEAGNRQLAEFLFDCFREHGLLENVAESSPGKTSRPSPQSKGPPVGGLQ